MTATPSRTRSSRKSPYLWFSPLVNNLCVGFEVGMYSTTGGGSVGLVAVAVAVLTVVADMTVSKLRRKERCLWVPFTLTTLVESLYRRFTLVPTLADDLCWARWMLEDCSSALRTDCSRQSTTRLRFGSIARHDIDQLYPTIWHTPVLP